MIHEDLRELVPPGIQARGSSYYKSKRVGIEEAKDGFVVAAVHGERPYTVTLRSEHDVILTTCSCPYYESHRATCKHVWATLLKLEDGSRFTGLTRARRLEADEDLLREFESAIPGRGLRDRGRPPVVRHAVEKRQPDWKKLTAAIGIPDPQVRLSELVPAKEWELNYILNLDLGVRRGELEISLVSRQRKGSGEWGKRKAASLTREGIDELNNFSDRKALRLLLGSHDPASDYSYSNYYYSGNRRVSSRYQLASETSITLLRELCRTGRAYVAKNELDQEPRPLVWDASEPWRFWLSVTQAGPENQYSITGDLRRGEDRVPLQEPRLIAGSGLVLFEDPVSGFVAAELEHSNALGWLAVLRQNPSILVPVEDEMRLIEKLHGMPARPPMDLPAALRIEEETGTPHPRLRIKKNDRDYWRPKSFQADVRFAYAGEVVPSGMSERTILDVEKRRLIRRDSEAEQQARNRLRTLGFKDDRGMHFPRGNKGGMTINMSLIPAAVHQLVAEGWHVEAEGKLYRNPGKIQIGVTSGVDWFDLEGKVDFDGTPAPLPELLAAIRRGESTVVLGDGSLGILPEEWLQKYAPLAALGHFEKGHLKFRRSQAGLLDALLSGEPEAKCDAVFETVRRELAGFQGIAPVREPAGFQGELREYQRMGLGWLQFLNRFGFGGCLADDMGLGKTVQVLAHLEARRPDRPGSSEGKPSLIVVPRSLVFNWKEESARFTPQLCIVDHTGIDRAADGHGFKGVDIVLTTYGTLRRDIGHLSKIEFDHVILDESQSIKNAGTQSAKAVRLLRADHRLALSGTPVENHLGELWSLFEFLNPGMLGAASVFNLAGSGGREISDGTREVLARALRPFILRRSKEQVASDLPARVEQTLMCELEPAERRRYEELRAHYRESLTKKIRSGGIGKAKIHILEALLRMRQAALHPGLIDETKRSETSAKLEVLLARLAESLEEGHKAIVFSQFTTMLSIVRSRLDRDGIKYAYLDGGTRDRKSAVEKFQTDPACRLFLISLKAGGLGLNLTAAEHVFLLDPWWNPAVEAQAIDRAHRIGQSKRVFAFRLVARDTVEEKIIQLQKSKRELADAILNADAGLIGSLTREDLEVLLS